MWSWLMTLILLIFIGFNSFSTPAIATRVSPGYKPLTTNGIPGYIIPESQAADILSWNEAVEGYWTPSSEDIEAAENAFFAEYEDSQNERAPVLDGTRQYLGYILGGDRVILVNSFCMDVGDAGSNWIEVDDGGPCFWQGVVSVDTGGILSISVNGEA